MKRMSLWCASLVHSSAMAMHFEAEPFDIDRKDLIVSIHCSAIAHTVLYGTLTTPCDDFFLCYCQCMRIMHAAISRSD